MRCHNCQVTVADDLSPEIRERAAFCANCGYPLARASSDVGPATTLPLPDGGTATIEVTIHSRGDGLLYYAINLAGDLPFRAQDGGARGNLGPRQQRHVVLEVRAEDVPAAIHEVGVEVHSLTRQPAQAGARRSEPVEELWELQATHRLRVERLTACPLLFTAEHLLFGKEVDTVSLRVINYGTLEASGTLDCSDGYEVAVNGGGFGLRADLVVPPVADGLPGVARIHVRAIGDAADQGWLTYRSGAGLPDQRHDVELERLRPKPAEAPPYRYTVGIDFGTSKTAVAWLDNYALGGRVRLVEWPTEVADQADRRYLPSAVLFLDGEGTALFGRRALTMSHRNGVEVRLREGGRQHVDRVGWLFVGMKMHLLSQGATAEGPTSREAAVRFLRYVLSHLKNEPLANGLKLDLSQTLFVLTLPVLDAGPEHERQAEETRAVFRDAASEVGLALAPTQVQCHAEPFCAAVDQAHELRRQAIAVGAAPDAAEGEWLLVFDCGAGTTDLSVARVKYDGKSIRFLQTIALGYRWGGDEIDDSLRRMLINEWVAPFGAAAQSTPRYLEVAEGEPSPEPPAEEASGWQAYFQEAKSLRFKGGQVVTNAELLGCVSHFKEKHFTEAAVEEPGAGPVTLAVPVASELGEGGIGELARATEEIDLPQFADRFGQQFRMVRDDQTGPLQNVWQTLVVDQLAGDRIQHVFLVGGGSLVSGCRDYVLSQRPEYGELAEVDRAWRRFHVARGAAQMLKVQVGSRLPEAATVEVGTWRADQGYQADEGAQSRQMLPAGTPDAERQLSAPASILMVDDPSTLVVARLLLGRRVLAQLPVSTEDVARALERIGGWSRGDAWDGSWVPVDAHVQYRPGQQLGLLVHLGIDEDDDAADPSDPPAPQATPLLVPVEPVKLPT